MHLIQGAGTSMFKSNPTPSLVNQPCGCQCCSHHPITTRPYTSSSFFSTTFLDQPRYDESIEPSIILEPSLPLKFSPLKSWIHPHSQCSQRGCARLTAVNPTPREPHSSSIAHRGRADSTPKGLHATSYCRAHRCRQPGHGPLIIESLSLSCGGAQESSPRASQSLQSYQNQMILKQLITKDVFLSFRGYQTWRVRVRTCIQRSTIFARISAHLHSTKLEISGFQCR